MERISQLGPTLGPILFQLPSRWHLNLARLLEFLQALDSRYRYAFEFRDPGWFDNRVYAALAAHQVAWCIYDFDRILSPLEVTTDFVYIRLHGPDGPYRGSYDDQALSVWAERIAEWQIRGKQVFCYFDNDQNAYAPQNALRLQRMLKQA